MPQPLTRRELEVARLVSEGRTNREIAEALVISERTAEGHVEQIRNKLGFHSRSQIAAWAVANPDAGRPALTRPAGLAAGNATAAVEIADIGAAGRRRVALGRRGRLMLALVATVALAALIGSVLLRATATAPLIVVAGLGTAGFSGDGGPAVVAQLDQPTSLAFDSSGRLYVADSSSALNAQGVYEAYTRIRRIDARGVISTIGGDGTDDPLTGDFAPHTRFVDQAYIAVAADHVFVAQGGEATDSQVIGVIDMDGRFRQLMASERGGYAGDGGPARTAAALKPRGIAVGALGNVYFADSANNVIREIRPDGTIATVAGTGARGASGDGGPATQALLFAPLGVAVAPDGSVYIADTNNHRVRRIDHGGTITTVAGDGTAGFAGDGGPATKAQLNGPIGLALDTKGRLFIADTGNGRVRMVTPDGTITTVAGDGTSAVLAEPTGVAISATGDVYIADRGTHKILERSRP